MKVARVNDRVLLAPLKGKPYLVCLRAGEHLHTHKGAIKHDDVIGLPLGSKVLSHLNHRFTVLQPSFHDVLMKVKRASQIIYPKEIGQILLKLDIGPGQRIIEAGTGSGALTLALAHGVQPDGTVYSYEIREDMLDVARRNLQAAHLEEYVELVQRDIAEGFSERDVEALFLDLREPWEYLAQACDALGNGGFFGALVPTTNQVSALLAEMKGYPFASIEVMEILIRYYKPVPQRLRPQDQMVAHTGFLIFARKIMCEAPSHERGAQGELVKQG